MMVRFVDDGGDNVEASSEGDSAIAPVVSIFSASSAGGTERAGNQPGGRKRRSGFSPANAGQRSHDEPEQVSELSESEACDMAEAQLLRKLRTRSLSASEARTTLGEHSLSEHLVEDLIEKFERLHYLDDAALAEQLVYIGSERKGQGRGAIAQTLSKRGISRDVAEVALSALGDDEDERALEFARSRASRMSSLDEAVALRRLHGQLARRGFGGHIAMTAARTALDELRRPASGVRFI
ncbi:regulatory protein RecX (plasmid) [Coraliomargarita sp. W4R53]